MHTTMLTTTTPRGMMRARLPSTSIFKGGRGGVAGARACGHYNPLSRQKNFYSVGGSCRG